MAKQDTLHYLQQAHTLCLESGLDFGEFAENTKFANVAKVELVAAYLVDPGIWWGEWKNGAKRRYTGAASDYYWKHQIERVMGEPVDYYVSRVELSAACLSLAIPVELERPWSGGAWIKIKAADIYRVLSDDAREAAKRPWRAMQLTEWRARRRADSR